MKIGSLFSGIGGLELGFEAEGFETAWFCENEPYAKEILKKHFPKTPIYGDITKIDFEAVPKVDILTGGFPCQDISNAGKRAGIEGGRSSLWKYYLKAIRILRPKFAVIENVSALTHRGLNVVLADIAKIGYDAEWYNISASSVGALHRRERIFIIAYMQSKRKRNMAMEWKQNKKKSNIERNCNAVENPKCNRCIKGNRDNVNRGEEEEEDSDKFACSSTNVSNTSKKRLEGGQYQKRQFDKQGWWSTEPNVGRMANGVSSRVDRIKCLGNAVVPQVSQVVAQAIKEVINKST